MKVVKSLKGLKNPIKKSVMTIGIFDGVHIGHMRLIKKVISRARSIHAKSVVVTFDPHPLKVLKGRRYIPTLISLNHRIRLIKSLGADYLVVLKFTKALSKIPPEKFVKEFLVKRLGLKEIYTSENFYFGRGGESGVETLRRMSKDFGFKVRVLKPVKRYASIVSSSLIRKFILNGDIDKASRLLERPVSILGTVVRGSRRGRILGFPTANINPHHEVLPPSGVYAVRVKVGKERLLKGVLNIGTRPTFFRGKSDAEPTVEVHIFNFKRKIYGMDLELLFVEKIRDEFKFKNRDELISRIMQDVKISRAILK